MNEFYLNNISQLYIHRSVEKLPGTLRGLEKLRELGIHEHRVVNDRSEIPGEHLRQSTLYLSPVRGEPLGHCPGSKGHICCNYHTLDLYMGCSLGCSYCVMQSYLNFSPITIQMDTSPMIDSIRRLAETNPDRQIRVGTGEVGDSLLFDPLFQLNGELMAALADIPNLVLEFKTKTDYVDHLLQLPGRKFTVIGFSLNTDEISRAEDGYSVSIIRRFEAAKRVLDAGMSVAFHFDPMIRSGDWKPGYEKLCNSILELHQYALEECEDPGNGLWPIAWVSMGTVRFTSALRDKIADRPYLYDEYSRGRDGKFRYLQPLRAELYRLIHGNLQPILEGERPLRLYMCMESDAMWRQVFGNTPAHIPELKPIFQPLRSAP
ncbi:Spore photoproduct lyase [Salinispira pacifica]|uniref:Spore photoproduct lyase n=1 Tax=Salinispira pacifica TaxID=1307761 RepID=V5WEQ6_9SPIO|nr:Spore photoproduct lyase [Salinispira pacifica]